jgi:hypothetical protein
MKSLKSLLIITVIVLVGILTVSNLSSQEQDKNKANYVKVIYFHGENRCSSCLKIEKYSSEAVNNIFKKEIEQGKVNWSVINFDEDKNKHYTDDYQLFNQTLIVAKYQNGKQVKWKACDKVWELLGDRKKFDKYIKDEVNKYLKG